MASSISVCLATYNGAYYLREQLHSIFQELNEYDEVIIVDDCSSDKSVEIIGEMADSRIRLFKNPFNLGHVKSFEKAMSLASNDILVLADQDDVWVEGRVRALVDAISKADTPALVYGDFIEFSDQRAEEVNFHPVKKIPKIRSRFHFFVLLLSGRTRMFGCCMAINRRLLESMLPFPVYISSHDLWAGYTATFFGQVINIKQPVTRRRLHAANVSTPRRGVLPIVLDRLYYLRKIVHRIWKFKCMKDAHEYQ